MLAPFALKLGPFDEGLNTFQDPSNLSERQAVRCIGAELVRGTLRGSWAPGHIYATLASDGSLYRYLMLYYHRGVGWLSSGQSYSNGYTNWACRDADDAAGNAISYVTQIAAANVFNVPRIYQGAANYPMGLTAPAAAPALTAGAGGNVQGQYTYVIESSGVNILESNPSARVTPAVASGGVYTAVASGDARITHIYYYQTKDADPNGITYFVGRSTNAAATLNAAGVAPNTSIPMNWGPGGSVDNPLVTFDHSPLGQVTCFSNRLHGGEDVVDGNQSGTLFYAIGQYIGWCKSGTPQYAPLRNLWKVPSVVVAQVAHGESMYSFTDTGTWVHTGVNDTVIQTNLVQNAYLIQTLAGKTAIDTPYGIIYMSREGLVLMNEYRSILLTDTVIDQKLLTGGNLVGIYFDHKYYLMNELVQDASGAYVLGVYEFDLRELPMPSSTYQAAKVKVTTHVLDVVGAMVMPVLAGAPIAGLYVVSYSTGNVKTWRPMERDNVLDAVQQTAIWRTGKLQMGQPMAQKEAHWLTIDGTGPVTLKFFPDPTDLSDDTKPAYTFAATLPMVRRRAVPQSVRGRSLSILLTVPPGSEVQSVLVEGNMRGELMQAGAS